MDLLDQVGLFEQDPGGPESVLQVAAVGLQFGGQGTVQDQVPTGGQQRAEGGVFRHAYSRNRKPQLVRGLPPYGVGFREQAAVL